MNKTFAVLVPVLALTAVSALVPGAEAASLLTNPGFETGDFTGWNSGVTGAVTSTPGFIPETILTGQYGARIFPSGQISQQLLVPDGVNQLKFGGWLRFFSFAPFVSNNDRGQISLSIGSAAEVNLGTSSLGLASSLAANRVTYATDWLFFEEIVNVSGLGGQTALLTLSLQDLGSPGNTAVAFDDLFVETVSIPTPALLPGLIGLGLGVLRRKHRALLGGR